MSSMRYFRFGLAMDGNACVISVSAPSEEAARDMLRNAWRADEMKGSGWHISVLDGVCMVLMTAGAVFLTGLAFHVLQAVLS